jgi:flagellar assembly protein FliH
VVVQLDGAVLEQEPLPATPAERARTNQAADIVESARRRSEELLLEASLELERVEDGARRGGYQQGYAEGLAAAQAELAKALEVVQAAARDARAVREQLVRSSEGDVIELVIEALSAIVGRRAEDDRELVVETVRRALDRVGAQDVVRVRTHPDDADTVRAWLHDEPAAATAWEVRADGAVTLGGCVIDTGSGVVDARLDVQLAQVAAQLRSAVPHA